MANLLDSFRNPWPRQPRVVGGLGSKLAGVGEVCQSGTEVAIRIGSTNRCRNASDGVNTRAKGQECIRTEALHFTIVLPRFEPGQALGLGFDAQLPMVQDSAPMNPVAGMIAAGTAAEANGRPERCR